MADSRSSAVRRALGALRIEGPLAYSWFGERFELDESRFARVPEEAVWQALTRWVQIRLYSDFYTQGTPVPAIDRRLVFTRSGDRELVHALSAANRGDGARQSGWAVVGTKANAVTIARDGVTIEAPRDRYVPDGGGDPRAGASGTLLLPNGLPDRAPGYYLALGNRVPEGHVPRARIYWNLTAAGSIAVLAALTGMLNEATIPYEYKCLSDESAYRRCDTGVLYLHRDDLDRAREIACGVAVAHPGALKPRAPALTAPIAPGVAWADDPGSGESFGMHRCGLIATGVVGAFRNGATDVLACVRGEFEAAGLDFGRPHLAPAQSRESVPA